MEVSNSSASRGYSENGKDNVFSQTSTPFSGDGAVTILYGTVPGNAEVVANKLAATLRGAGIIAGVRDIARSNLTC